MTQFVQPGSLQFDEVAYAYGDSVEPAIEDFTAAIAPGELVVIVGPSGCGKSTLLKIVAGLISPSHGQLIIDGKNVIDRPTQQRGIGWVPQSYALFDHLNVVDNIGFGLKMQRLPKAQRKRRIQTLLSLCQISELARRSVRDLSGGQRQRVAIARALAVQPSVLLLDEPLAALDPQLRETLRAGLVKLVKESGATTLFVTHDQAEALAIADRIIVLKAGHLEQYDTPENLWNCPANGFVAEFISNANVIQAHRINRDEVEVASGLVGKIDPNRAPTHSHKVQVALRPSDVRVDSHSDIRTLVTDLEYTGGRYLIRSHIPDGPQLSFFSPKPLEIGTTVPITLEDTQLAIVGSSIAQT